MSIQIPPEIDELLEETPEETEKKPERFYDIRWFLTNIVVFILSAGLVFSATIPVGTNFQFRTRNPGKEKKGAGLNISYAEEWEKSSLNFNNLSSFNQQQTNQVNERSENGKSEASAIAGQSGTGSLSIESSTDITSLGSQELKGRCGFEQFEPDHSESQTGIKKISGYMKDFGSLYGLFKRAGVGTRDGSEILSAASRVINIKSIRAEDFVSIYLHQNGEFWFLELRRSPTKIFHFLKSENGLIDAHRVEFPTRREWVKGGGVVHGSLFTSAENSGLDGSIAGYFTEVLGAYINFEEQARDGDIFKVITSAQWIGNKFISYDPPQGIFYSGKKTGEITAIRFPPEGENGKYYKPDGMALKEILAEVPLKTVRVTSPFNLRRFHPILKVIKPHTGVDLGAPKGTPVYAFDDGIVKVAKMEGAMGNMIHIEHCCGISTYYGHLNGFARGIKSNIRVKRGQLIGFVGSTGRSTGPHLHFGYKKNNAWLDPLKFLQVKTTTERMIDDSLKEAFMKRARTILSLLAGIETGASNQRVKQEMKNETGNRSTSKQAPATLNLAEKLETKTRKNMSNPFNADSRKSKINKKGLELIELKEKVKDKK